MNLDLLKIGAPSKKLPRGRPFKKGERLPFQFKPGQSGNPSGKSKKPKTMKANYEELLGSPAPLELCRAVGAPPESTLAEVFAQGMLVCAVLYDTAAAKEIREVVEGRIPDAVDEKHVIDYTAGQSFKEQLLRKLVPSDDLGHAEQEARRSGGTSLQSSKRRQKPPVAYPFRVIRLAILLKILV